MTGRRSADATARAVGRKLDDPEAVIEAKVGVEPPTELRVKLFRAVDIRDGDDDNLELHVDSRDAVASILRTALVLMAASCVVSFLCLHCDRTEWPIISFLEVSNQT